MSVILRKVSTVRHTLDLFKFWKCQKAVFILPHEARVLLELLSYFAFGQIWLIGGKIDPAVVLPHDGKNTWFYMGGSGLDRTDGFQNFVDQGWIGFNLHRQDWIRTEKFHSPLISDSDHLWSAEWTRGDQSHFFRLRLRSCSKIF